jgi:ankyrin repeat protein
MHLAARSNAINVAKLLKHIYDDANHDDSNLEISPEQISPQKAPKSPGSTRSNMSSSDNMIYFDVDRVNNQGQTPIFLTVNSRSIDMLKFLMENKCNITIRDQRGDTIKDYIYRYM